MLFLHTHWTTWSMNNMKLDETSQVSTDLRTEFCSCFISIFSNKLIMWESVWINLGLNVYSAFITYCCSPKLHPDAQMCSASYFSFCLKLFPVSSWVPVSHWDNCPCVCRESGFIISRRLTLGTAQDSRDSRCVTGVWR